MQLPGKQNTVLPPRGKLRVQNLKFSAFGGPPRTIAVPNIFFKYLCNNRCTQLTCISEACQALRQSSVLM